ncbi:MAG: hypothetical protein WKG01_07150 [Kofleriaceae bacterium]
MKNLLGLGAIGGALYYARKNGGIENAFNGLLAKARGVKDNMIGKAQDAAGQSNQSTSSFASTSADDSATTGYGSGTRGGNIRH